MAFMSFSGENSKREWPQKGTENHKVFQFLVFLAPFCGQIFVSHAVPYTYICTDARVAMRSPIDRWFRRTDLHQSVRAKDALPPVHSSGLCQEQTVSSRLVAAWRRRRRD